MKSSDKLQAQLPPRQLGYVLHYHTLAHALEHRDDVISALLHHGVIVLQFREKTNTPDHVERFLAAMGTPELPGPHYRKVQVSPNVHVIGNVDASGAPRPENYRHAGFWHTDGQFYPDYENTDNVLVNVMCPVMLNQCRTQFLDVTLHTPNDLQKYHSLSNAQIRIQRRQENGELVADVTKPVWRHHPLTGKVHLLVASTRYLPDEPFSGTRVDCAWKLAAEVREELASEAGRRYDHEYAENQLLVWDNAQILHRAEGTADEIRGPRYILDANLRLSRDQLPKTRPFQEAYDTVIIGAGASGIVVASELLRHGVDDFCLFEKATAIGGIYSDLYEGARLVSSNNITSFSTMPIKHKESMFPSTDEYLAYLREFAERSGVVSKIFFEHRVISIDRPPGSRPGPGDGWSIRVQSGPDGPMITVRCKHLVVCTGVHAKPVSFEFPMAGDKPFAGRIINATDVEDPVEFKDKVVVVVGGGEMASDLVLFTAEQSKKTYASVRGMGRVVPRTLLGRPLDTSLSRGFHQVNRNWDTKGPVQWRFRATRRRERKAGDTVALLREWNAKHSGNLTAFSRYGTKTDAMARAVLDHGAQIKPPIRAVDGEEVVFEDDSRVRADVIINCMGFRADLGMLPRPFHCLQLDNLYLRMLHPRLRTDVAFVGFVRPEAGAIPPMAEMQARYLAGLISGRLALPSVAEMYEEIRRQKERDLFQFPLDSCRYPALTDFYFYLEDLAARIGCRPRLSHLLQHPRALWKTLWGPLSPVQYRLDGPGAEREKALETLTEMTWSKLWPDVVFLTPLWAVSELHRVAWARSPTTVERRHGYKIELRHGYFDERAQEIEEFLKEHFWPRSPVVARLLSRKVYDGADVARTVTEGLTDAVLSVLMRYEGQLVGTLFVKRVEGNARRRNGFAGDLDAALELCAPPFQGKDIYRIVRVCMHRDHCGRWRSAALISAALLELEERQATTSDLCVVSETATAASYRVFSRLGFETYARRNYDDYIPWKERKEFQASYMARGGGASRAGTSRGDCNNTLYGQYRVIRHRF